MLTVEPATEADIDELVELESALFAEDAGRHDPHADITWPRRQGREDLEELIAADRAIVLVARRPGCPAGLLIGYSTPSSPTRQPIDYAVLRTLYVAPADRRSGAASALIDRFVEWARERGCVEAHVDHYAANGGAGALYERHGFEVRSVSRARPL